MDFRFAPGTSWAGYIIEAPLGAGRTGETYRARRGSSGSQVALKVCWPKLAESGDFVFAFQHQAKLLQKLQSPAIVGMLDAGINKGLPFCVSEYVPGPRGEPLTLRQIIAEKASAGKYLKVEAAAAFAINLCDSLIALHSFRDEADCPGGLFAGELRPENILIDAKNVARIADAGFDTLAKTAGAEGPVHYASPAVCEGKPATAEADTHALGLIVYELLTNRRPDDPPKPPSQLRKSVRTGWDVLILERCLASDPAKCIADATSLKKALEKLAAAALQEAARKGTLAAKTLSPSKPVGVPPGAPVESAEGAPKRRFPPYLITAVSLVIAAIGCGIVFFINSGSKSTKPAAPTSVPVVKPAPAQPQPSPVTKTQDLPRTEPKPPVVVATKRPPVVKPQATKPAEGQPVVVTDLGLTMNWIPAGDVMMGSGADERAYATKYLPTSEVHVLAYEIEKNVHLANGFWLGETEVTVGQWKKFIAANAGFKTDAEKRDIGNTIKPDGSLAAASGVNWREPIAGEKSRNNFPVTCVTPRDAEAFCAWLTKQERDAGRIPENFIYRLPTQTEWEYACRGTKKHAKFWWGDDDAENASHMNAAGGEFSEKYPATKPHNFSSGDAFVHLASVDSFGANGRNEFGLADMLGNVWEAVSKPLMTKYKYAWCGGSFAEGPGFDRCAANRHHFTERPSANAGFRICLAHE